MRKTVVWIVLISTAEPRIELDVGMEVVARPELSVRSADSLDFGMDLTALDLVITNANNGVLEWRATGTESWISVAEFYFHLETEILKLEEELLGGTYVPRPYRSFMVYEPKPRKICAADIRDRVLHHAICTVLEPIFESFSIHDSYACRKDKGTHRAIRRCHEA